MSRENRAVLRLPPAHPPLWRTATTLQFGVDGIARLDDVTAWQERLLEALRDGIPADRILALAICYGADGVAAERFVERLRPALEPVPPSGPIVILELPCELPEAEASAIAQGLVSAGVRIAQARTWAGDNAGHPVIAVARRLLDPRRAAQLVRDDVVHLPIELAGDRATVGPVVVPGRTPCTACLHAHRSDDDPVWPVLAAQLLERRAPPTDPGVLLEAGVLAGRMLRDERGEATASVSLEAGSVRRTWRAHRPHARCLCRSPEGTATAGALYARSCEPMTSKVSEQRA